MKTGNIAFIIISVFVVFLIVANPFSDSAMLKRLELANLSVEDMVSRLESGEVRPEGLVAYINPTHLVLEMNNRIIKRPLPTDKFYMSLAPFINTSHICVTHYLTQCTSELANQPFHIKVVAANGDVIIEENRVSESNGFIGIWLPRDLEATLHIEFQDYHVSAPIATTLESPTCITTPLQLVKRESVQN